MKNVASRNSTGRISRILVTINVALGAFSWSRRGRDRLRSGQCFRRYHRHAQYWCKSAEHNDYVREHFYGRTQLHSNISVEFVDDGPFQTPLFFGTTPGAPWILRTCIAVFPRNC